VLNRSHRLKKNKEIERVLRMGKRFSEEPLVMRVLPNKTEESRFTFVVSQKFSKKAVDRNSARRRIGRVVEENWEAVKKGVDVIILLGFNKDKQIMDKLGLLTEKLLQKTGLISDLKQTDK